MAHELVTLGDIARLLNVAHHRVAYAVQRAGIEPKQRVGNLRAWANTDLPAIRDAITATAQASKRKASTQ